MVTRLCYVLIDVPNSQCLGLRSWKQYQLQTTGSIQLITEAKMEMKKYNSRMIKSVGCVAVSLCRQHQHRTVAAVAQFPAVFLGLL